MWCYTKLFNLEINFNLLIRHGVIWIPVKKFNLDLFFILNTTISLKPTYEYYLFHGLTSSSWDFIYQFGEELNLQRSLAALVLLKQSFVDKTRLIIWFSR